MRVVSFEAIIRALPAAGRDKDLEDVRNLRWTEEEGPPAVTVEEEAAIDCKRVPGTPVTIKISASHKEP